MLNNLVGRPVVEMQTQGGNSVTPQHFQEERQTGCTHRVPHCCLDMKNGLSRASAGAYVYFWGGYNSKRSTMR